MPENPQVHRVWITEMVTWSIQPPTEHVFVVCASSVEALAHPFPFRQLTGKGKFSAVIPAAQTVLAGWGELVSPNLQAVVAQILSQCQGTLAHGTYKGPLFSACWLSSPGWWEK